MIPPKVLYDYRRDETLPNYKPQISVALRMSEPTQSPFLHSSKSSTKQSAILIESLMSSNLIAGLDGRCFYVNNHARAHSVSDVWAARILRFEGSRW